MSANVDTQFSELGEPENLGIAVGILSLSFIQRAQDASISVCRPYLNMGVNSISGLQASCPR
jgi:hypothetical protein